MTSIYTYTVEGIDGKEIDLAQFKGKKLLIVNVASVCGFTTQYAQLQELYENLQDTLTILGCPSNDFGGQEPGSNEEIQAFCDRKFKVTFPMSTKINILGKSQHPLYRWLTNKEYNGVMDSEVRWNFYKYLIDEQGNLARVFPSSTDPVSDEVLEALGVNF